MPPAARILDMHVCPLATPNPHVGGPIVTGQFNVKIGKMPAARITDKALCKGPIDKILKGSPTVIIGKLNAARMFDPTIHGGIIITGCFTVIIGDFGKGAFIKGLPPVIPQGKHEIWAATAVLTNQSTQVLTQGPGPGPGPQSGPGPRPGSASRPASRPAPAPSPRPAPQPSPAIPKPALAATPDPSSTPTSTPTPELQDPAEPKTSAQKPPAQTPPAPCSADTVMNNLKACDGGTGIVASATASLGKAPVIKMQTASTGFAAQADLEGGAAVITPTTDCCAATESAVHEMTNLSNKARFAAIGTDVAAGKLSRTDYTKAMEKIEYDGVHNGLKAFGACKAKWGCAAGAVSSFDGFRGAKDFDDYYNNYLATSHKEYYGKFWDTNFKAAYDKAHP